MRPDAPILAFDTSAAHVAAVVFQGGKVLAAHFEDRAKGQDQVLLGVCSDLLAKAGVAWGELGKVAVGVGPGNFTGVRISVSAALGIAAGRGVPAIGVNGFDAALWDAPAGALACIAAPRTQIYVSNASVPAQLIDLQTTLDPFAGAACLVGSGAQAAADATDLPIHPTAYPQAEAIARVAAAQAGPFDAPKPMYIKRPDAAPSRVQAPQVVG